MGHRMSQNVAWDMRIGDKEKRKPNKHLSKRTADLHASRNADYAPCLHGESKNPRNPVNQRFFLIRGGVKSGTTAAIGDLIG